MNTLHMLLRALGACLLIVLGSVVANWIACVLIMAVSMALFGVWRIFVRRRDRG